MVDNKMKSAFALYRKLCYTRGYTEAVVGEKGIFRHRVGHTIAITDCNAGIIKFIKRFSSFDSEEAIRTQQPEFDYSKQSPAEQESQDIVDLICEAEGIERVPVVITKHARGSYAHLSKWYLTLGGVTIKEEIEAWFWAVTIHEACHFAAWVYGDSGHGDSFKQFETKWLYEFGLQPQYKRSYKKYLATLDGTIIWSDWNHGNTKSLKAASAYFRKGN